MKLSTTIGPSYNVGESDTLEVKRALLALGHYTIPSYGLTPYPDQAMFDGIKAVQRALGLSPTGVMRPDGPEHRAIAASLEAEGGAGGPGIVHVRAYSQDRAGHAVQVSAHERGAPGAGANAPVGGSSGLPKMENPVHDGTMRQCDGSPYGCGHFGARRMRNGKPYSHEGVDIAVPPGKPIYSPVAGTIIRNDIDPYGNGKFQGTSIRTDDGHVVRILYVNSHLRKGTRVEPGTPIGTAQDLSPAYPPVGKTRMTNHVHVEVIKNGTHVDPTGLLFQRKQ
jgi:murein DD-endopeptidase MepM/ murein hydrolase activator NlpD